VQIAIKTRQQLLPNGMHFFNDGVFPHDASPFNGDAHAKFVGLLPRSGRDSAALSGS
jgi:hypothetical protein